jgi:hypothetical protein
MNYFVTFETFDDEGRRGPVGIDSGLPSKPLDVADALERARQLILEEKHHVTIRNDNGNSISGDDLAACCKGDKTLTVDLQAISN